MARRSIDFDLTKAITDPGFTAAERDVPELLDLLIGGPPVVRDRAERALRRVGMLAVLPAITRARASSSSATNGTPAPRHVRALSTSGAGTSRGDVARGRLVTLVGRIAGADPPDEVRSFLLEALGDGDAGVRRRAAESLGRASVRREEVERALADNAGREQDGAARAAMIEALGKLGGTTAREALATLTNAPAARDAKTETALRKARVRAVRPEARERSSGVIVAEDAGRPLRVWLDCRRGMLPVLLEEAAALRPRVEHRIDGGMVAALDHRGPLAALFASRTWGSLALPGGVEKVVDGDKVRAASLAIAHGPAREAVAALTRGPVRYRLGWATGGKRRASVFAIAEAVAAIDPSLVNDPTSASWHVIVRDMRDRVGIEWSPSLDDPRFGYRLGDVPAASHPTIAAALAFVAGVKGEDVVWDPFVGSGLELCERARLGAYARLVGTDIDPKALGVARKNLTSCGAERFELVERDAALGPPPGARPSLVITNPPMGRRVHRQADLCERLVGVVTVVARTLAPHGRFVWVCPFAADMRAAAEAGGLVIRRAHVIDLGGFEAELQVWTKPA